VAGGHVTELVSRAAELEHRDAVVAAELELLADLAGRAGEVRSRAADVAASLERLPGALDDLARLVDGARAETEHAREQARLARERLDSLEHARRRKQDEVERAAREAATAAELLADAEARVERLWARADELRASEMRLRAEAVGLGSVAAQIAAELARAPRIADSPGLEPGTTLAELEQWGLVVRSTVLVARGALEADREQLVVEANALAARVLGDQLGASSVAVVRRQLEQLV
jgi:chromosome segregation ATPase